MSHLRSSLLPGLCDALALNASRGNLEGKFFETGHTFLAKQGKLYEQFSIAFVRRLTPKVETFAERSDADFFSARAVLESLMRAAGLPFGEPDWERIEKSSIWQAQHAARRGCILCGQAMMRAGLVNLELLKSAGVDGTVLAGEIVVPLELFASIDSSPKHYAPFSEFPSVRKDISLLADASKGVGVTFEAVRAAAAKACEGKFDLESVRLFDRYAGKGIAEGKVSLAYALSFRSMERTLTDKEVNEAFAAAIATLKASGYELRG
jgi:phenylalanyl-tRNA synthetase beta chain